MFSSTLLGPFAGDDCLYFLFEQVESRAAFDKSGGRPPLYLGRTCQADRRRYAYFAFWFLKGCQSDMLATTFFIPA